MSGATISIFPSILTLLFPPPWLRRGVSYHPPTSTKRPSSLGYEDGKQRRKRIAQRKRQQSVLTVSFSLESRSLWQILFVSSFLGVNVVNASERLSLVETGWEEIQRFCMKKKKKRREKMFYFWRSRSPLLLLFFLAVDGRRLRSNICFHIIRRGHTARLPLPF